MMMMVMVMVVVASAESTSRVGMRGIEKCSKSQKYRGTGIAIPVYRIISWRRQLYTTSTKIARIARRGALQIRTLNFSKPGV